MKNLINLYFIEILLNYLEVLKNVTLSKKTDNVRKFFVRILNLVSVT